MQLRLVKQQVTPIHQWLRFIKISKFEKLTLRAIYPASPTRQTHHWVCRVGELFYIPHRCNPQRRRHLAQPQQHPLSQPPTIKKNRTFYPNLSQSWQISDKIILFCWRIVVPLFKGRAPQLYKPLEVTREPNPPIPVTSAR